MTHKTKVWRRDIALYGVIAGLVAWQTAHWEVTKEAVLGSILASCIAIKSKLSNGKPKDEGKPEGE